MLLVCIKKFFLGIIATNSMLVFCSELGIFLQNREVFISNFVKYYYCNLTQRIMYDVPTTYHQKIINLLLFMSLMFYNTKNLSSMDTSVSDVLNDATTEHATAQMKRYLNQDIKFTSNRANLVFGAPENLGSESMLLTFSGECSDLSYFSL